MIAALLCVGSAANSVAGEPERGSPFCVDPAAQLRPATVADTRSLALSDGQVLRLAGIESFALLDGEADRAEAELRAGLAALVAAGPVRFKVLAGAPDRYGRAAALVESSEGRLFQQELVGDGLAIAYATGDVLPCFDRLLAAEDAARRSHRGFWRSAELPSADPEALRSRIGGFAIFQGAVISVGNRRDRTYLNFGTHWSQDTTVEIAAADRTRFGGEAGLSRLEGRTVRVRGFLQEHGGPVMKVTSPMQIETLAEPADSAGNKP